MRIFSDWFKDSHNKDSELPTNIYVLILSVCLTICDPMDRNLPGSSVHEDAPGKNTGMGCHALLQGIFPTQGLRPDLLHCRWILYHLSHQGSPRILEWVAYPFSRGFSWSRSWTGVSCIAGRFFTSWATRETPKVRVGHRKLQNVAERNQRRWINGETSHVR